MPILQISKLVCEHDTRIWRIVDHHVDTAYKKKSYSEVVSIGCDETSIRKGHHYVTIFANMDNGEVMFAVKGKDSGTMKALADELTKKENPLLTGSGYILLKNPASLTVKQKGQLAALRNENLKTAKSYQMKLTFQDIYRNIYDPISAETAIKKCLSLAVRSGLERIKCFAKMV